MFAALVELVCDEGPGRLSQNPLLYNCAFLHGLNICISVFSIIVSADPPHLHARRQSIDIFGEFVVKEWRPRFYTVGHFRAVAQTAEEYVCQMSLCPDVLGAVQGVPFPGNQRAHTTVNIVCDR